MDIGRGKNKYGICLNMPLIQRYIFAYCTKNEIDFSEKREIAFIGEKRLYGWRKVLYDSV